MKMADVDDKPFRGAWKQVTYIDHQEQKGKYDRTAIWYGLTLECGHHKTVHGGTSSPLDIVTVQRLRSAPKKVRCLICPEGV